MDYSLSNSPPWLELDSSSRTLHGVPGPGDAGAPSINLIATDNTGPSSMAVTLVVSGDPGPGLGVSVSDQLSAYGAFSSPSSLLISHSSSLHLSFSKSTFTNTNTNTVYYALCANNTPLPSWIHFDSSTLSFSGTSPESTSPAEISQKYDIHLTASDVVGFSGAIASFQLVLESHVFAFGEGLNIINATQGVAFNLGLRNDLTLDNIPVKTADLTQIGANTPDWVSLDKSTLLLTGTPPASATSQNITVTATDSFGDVASTVVQILLSGATPVKIFQGPFEILNATIGDDFDYTLNSSLSMSSNLVVSADLGTATSWLKFDPAALRFHGSVPSSMQPQQDLVNITASQGGQSQSQELTIAIQKRDEKNSSESSPSKSSEPAAASSPTGPSKSPSANPIAGAVSRKHWLPAAILIPIVIVLGILVIASLYVRKRRQRRMRDRPPTPSKEKISRPIVQESSWITVPDNEIVETMDPSRKRKFSKPPIIDLSEILSSGPNNRRSRIRSSRATVDEGRQNPKLDSWREYLGEINHLRPASAVVSEASRIPERRLLKREIGNHFSHKYSSSESLLAESVPIRRPKRHGKSRSGYSLFSTQHLHRFGRAASGMGHGVRLSTGAFGPSNGGPPGYGMVRGSWRNTIATSVSTPDYATTTDSSSRYPTRKHSGIFSSLVEAFPPTPTSKTMETLLRATTPLIPELRPTRSPDRTTIRLIQPSPHPSPNDHASSSAATPNDFSTLEAYHKQRVSSRQTNNPLFLATTSTPTLPVPSFRPGARRSRNRSASLSSSQRFGSAIADDDYSENDNYFSDDTDSVARGRELEEDIDAHGRKYWRHVPRPFVDANADADADVWTDASVSGADDAERERERNERDDRFKPTSRREHRVVLGEIGKRPISVDAAPAGVGVSVSMKGEIGAFL